MILALVFSVCWMPYNLIQLVLDHLDEDEIKRADNTSGNLVTVSHHIANFGRMLSINYQSLFPTDWVYFVGNDRWDLSVYGWATPTRPSIRCFIACFRATFVSHFGTFFIRPVVIFTARSLCPCLDAAALSIKSKKANLFFFFYWAFDYCPWEISKMGFLFSCAPLSSHIRTSAYF